MLFLVSDLHLTDCIQRNTFDFRAFEQTLRDVVAQAEREKVLSLKVVLLGDIFEMLKTSVWLDEDVRPWHGPSSKKTAAVTKIMGDIIAGNPEFFALLNDLCTRHSVSLVYVPGNHDYMLNADAGKEARKLLRQALPLGVRDGRKFKNEYQDAKHQLIALHGHQWDSHNVYRGDTRPIGDVVVIEILVRLPILVAQYLGIPVNDSRLEFVHEIDNVTPQTPHAMARWLTRGLDKLADMGLNPAVIDKAFVAVAEAIATTISSATFEGVGMIERWSELLNGIAGVVIPKWGALRLALPFRGSDLRESYAELAADTVQSLTGLDLDYRFVAYGHTHACETAAISGVRGPHIYFNLGTWRRCHRMTRFAADPNEVDFASCIENTYVIVRTPDETGEGRPRYTFNQTLYAC